MKRKLVNVPLAAPIPLKEWIDISANEHGMSRNAFLCFVLQIHRATGGLAAMHQRLKAVEERLGMETA